MGSSSRSTSAGRHELLGQAEPAALAAAQPGQRPGARLVGIEAEAVEHGVDPGGEGVAALAVEALEIAVVARQHLRRAAVARLGERGRLLRQRVLQREQLGERAGRGLPHRRGAGELAVLLHDRVAEPARPGHGARRSARSRPVMRRNSVVLPEPFRPMMPHRSPRATVKRDVAQEPGGAELDGDAGERELGHRPVQSRQVASASPTVSCCWWRTSGHAQQQRLLGQLLEPALLAQPRGAEPEVGEAAGLAVDQRLDAELLREAPELAGRGRRAPAGPRSGS